MKPLFSIVGIIVVLIWGYKSYKRETDKRELKKSIHVVEAKILELSCGKRGNIKFQLNDRIYNQRIYLSHTECPELSNQKTIGVKIDSERNIIFANDNYNDWSEAESVSIVLLCLFLISLITYYGIISDIKKPRKRN
jgi:hypothetical protein